MYSQKILNIFLRPKNIGTTKKPSASKVYENEALGISIKFSINVDEENTIKSAKAKVCGDVLYIVASNVLCDIIIGKNIDELSVIDYNIFREKTFNEIPDEILMETNRALLVTVADFIKKQSKTK